ncbi:MAG: PorV/PorQ family protein [Candidatus Eisenbacteria bacterium]|nr:PorV/PorQ family protein [Candidatus Eisenbacteria bacterium]
MNRKGVLAAVALLALAGTAWAGSENRIGTAGAPELRIPVGTRTWALAGAAIADVQGAEAAFWNPAGIVLSERNEAYVSHMKYIADMKLNFMSVLYRTDENGTLAISAKVLDIGGIIVTNEENPEGTGQVTSPTFTVLGFSYARRFTDRVSFGGTVSVINESVLQERANGLAFDLGFQYALNWHGVRLAAVLKNWGPQMRYDGPDLETFFIPPGGRPDATGRSYRSVSGDFEMPAQVQIAATGNVFAREGQRLSLSGAFVGNNFYKDEYRFGAEYAYRNTLFLRGGWTYSDAKTAGSSDNSYLYGFTGGAGLSWPMGDNRVDIGYAFTQVRNYFSQNHTFSVRYLF